jgi:hypothetical protein
LESRIVTSYVEMKAPMATAVTIAFRQSEPEIITLQL